MRLVHVPGVNQSALQHKEESQNDQDDKASHFFFDLYQIYDELGIVV